MKPVKITTTILIVISIIILIAFAWGLINVSGILPTAISPIAYERLNYSNLRALSEIVILIKKDTPDVKWDIELFNKYSDNNQNIMCELPNKQQYSIYIKPVSDFNIIISGHKMDEFDMIWAVTDKGDVIKISASELKLPVTDSETDNK